MNKDKNHKEKGIPAEKMAILAEKGLKAAKLTKEEKQFLLKGGLTELCDVLEFTKQNISPLESETVERIVEQFFTPVPLLSSSSSPIPPTSVIQILWIRIKQRAIELIESPKDVYKGSPAFAHRGEEAKGISFYKKSGSLTMHLKIVSRDATLADIHVRLTDSSGKNVSSFEVELLKGERCIEAVSISRDNTASLSSVEPGDYMIRISDSNGETGSIPLKIE